MTVFGTYLPAGSARASVSPPQFSGRGKDPEYEKLPPADKFRLLTAWLYTDLSQPKLPRYTRAIRHERWASLYEQALDEVLADLSPAKTPNAHRFFTSLKEPVQAMKRKQGSARLIDPFDRRAVKNLEKIEEIGQIIALTDPKVRAAALEDAVTRLFVNPGPKTPWYLK